VNKDFIFPNYSLLTILFFPAADQSQRLPRMPATGYRTSDAGAFLAVGANGYAWSSSPYASGNFNVGFLNFNSGNVNPLNNTWRAHGMPVRCVQHLRESCCPECPIARRKTTRTRSGGGQDFSQSGGQIQQSADVITPLVIHPSLRRSRKQNE